MKNAKWILIPLLIAVVFAGAVMGASAANGTPGSESDPVVTKSYVDQTVRYAAEAAAKSAAEAAAQSAVSEALDEKVAELEAATAKALASSGGTAFAVINVPAGTGVIGKSGTEIIVRSGSATAIDNGEDGICDITAGVDLTKGQTAVNNHLLLCPRDDGRGVQAQTELWIMIRGDYTLR